MLSTVIVLVIASLVVIIAAASSSASSRTNMAAGSNPTSSEVNAVDSFDAIVSNQGSGHAIIVWKSPFPDGVEIQYEVTCSPPPPTIYVHDNWSASLGGLVDSQSYTCDIYHKSSGSLRSVFLDSLPATVTYPIVKVLDNYPLKPVAPVVAGGGLPTQYSLASTSGPLPDGLVLNESTGELSGQPSGGNGGAFSVEVEASNKRGSVVVKLKIELVPSPPSQLSYANVMPTVFYVGGKYDEPLAPQVVGSVKNMKFTLDSLSPLPAGLKFDTATGAFSGSPKQITSKAAFSVTCTNDQGSVTASVTITVVTATPPAGAFYPDTVLDCGMDIVQPIRLSLNGGGQFVSADSFPPLPSGLYFAPDGSILGKPSTCAMAGSTTKADFQISLVTLGGVLTTKVALTVQTLAPAVQYSSAGLVGLVGLETQPVAPTLLSTSGAVGSYTITPQGSLPNGLFFNTTSGVISGTPTEVLVPGLEFTVTAKNPTGSVDSIVTVKVVDLPPPLFTYEQAVYTFTYTAAASTLSASPVVDYNSIAHGKAQEWSVVPPLPAGLAIDAQSGKISGSPSFDVSAPQSKYTVIAKSAGGASSRFALTIAVNGKDQAVPVTTGVPEGPTTSPVTVTKSYWNSINVGSGNTIGRFIGMPKLVAATGGKNVANGNPVPNVGLTPYDIYLSSYDSKDVTGSITFTIPVDSIGSYNIRLHFTNQATTVGQRAVSLFVEGVAVGPTVDLFAVSAAGAAYMTEVSALVTDGEMNIELRPLVGNTLPLGGLAGLEWGNHDLITIPTLSTSILDFGSFQQSDAPSVITLVVTNPSTRDITIQMIQVSLNSAESGTVYKGNDMFIVAVNPDLPAGIAGSTVASSAKGTAAGSKVDIAILPGKSITLSLTFDPTVTAGSISGLIDFSGENMVPVAAKLKAVVTVPPPTITKVTPNPIDRYGGKVTVTGGGFEAGVTVTYNGANVKSTITPGKFTFTAPAIKSDLQGSALLVVTTGSGSVSLALGLSAVTVPTTTTAAPPVETTPPPVPVIHLP